MLNPHAICSIEMQGSVTPCYSSRHTKNTSRMTRAEIFVIDYLQQNGGSFRLQVFPRTWSLTNRELHTSLYVCDKGLQGEGDGEPLAEPIFSVQIWMFLTRKKLLNSWSFYWDQCRNLKKWFISIQKFLSLHPLGVWSFFCDETCMFLKPSSF